MEICCNSGVVSLCNNFVICNNDSLEDSSCSVEIRGVLFNNRRSSPSRLWVESSQSIDDTNILQVNLKLRDKGEFVSIKLSLTPLN